MLHRYQAPGNSLCYHAAIKNCKSYIGWKRISHFRNTSYGPLFMTRQRAAVHYHAHHHMNMRIALIIGASALASPLASHAQEKAAESAEKPAITNTFEAAGGKYRFIMDTTVAPDLTEWAKTELTPVVREWYPKIIGLLPSEGYEAPTNVTIRFREDMGRTPASAGGGRVNCNAEWFKRNLKGEAIGAVVHELVHVVQQYGLARRNNPDATRTPGWLVEGIPDYIRWFLYEPHTKGAEITQRNLARARYDASYRVTGNFLNWVTTNYHKEIVVKLNAAAREGRYKEEIWKECTGKELASLGEEWKKGHEDRLGAAEPPPRTTLSDPAIKFTVPEKPYVVLRRGAIEAVIVDNRAVDDAVLPGHKAGYHGVASLKHERQPRNLFVPAVSGLNFEHIHDGTTRARDLLFEPRRAPMMLRAINEHTVELHQPPTPHWGLESCARYELQEDGVLQLTFECIPRRSAWTNNYLGLFWASYIDQPKSLDIHFRSASDWVRGVTPEHGVRATHRAPGDERQFAHDADFPLSLVFNFSEHRYGAPWYFGLCREMAFVQLFDARDQVRLTQSPSGGGRGNPAWDFQWFIENPKVGRRYQLVMRALYLPAADTSEAREEVRREIERRSRR
jgi:Peptidase of plants and bacteria